MSIKSPGSSPEPLMDSVKNIYAKIDEAYREAFEFLRNGDTAGADIKRLQAAGFQDELLEMGGNAIVLLFGEPLRELLPFLRLPVRNERQSLKGTTFFAFDILTDDGKYRHDLDLQASAASLLDSNVANSDFGLLAGARKLRLYGEVLVEKSVYAVMIDVKFMEKIRTIMNDDKDRDHKVTFVSGTTREAELRIAPRPTMPCPASEPQAVSDVRRAAVDAVTVATPVSGTDETVPFRDDVPDQDVPDQDVPEPNLDPARKLELIVDGPPSTVTPSRLMKDKDEK